MSYFVAMRKIMKMHPLSSSLRLAVSETLIMKRLLLSLLLITAGVVHQANAQDNGTSYVLTLDQAIAIALQNNREAKSARLEIEKAGDKLDAYRTRRLPSFKISSLVSQPLNTIDTTFERGKECYQTVHRFCGSAVWHGGRAGGAVDHGSAVRVHGILGDRESRRCDYQSHHRALRLH